MAQTEKNEAKARYNQKYRILTALRQGKELTSYQANNIGHTVDARKIISRLREDGYRIYDYWETGKDGRKFKVYFLDGADCFVTHEWLIGQGFKGVLSAKSTYYHPKAKIFFRVAGLPSLGLNVSIRTKDKNVLFNTVWKPSAPGMYITRGEFLDYISKAGVDLKGKENE